MRTGMSGKKLLFHVGPAVCREKKLLFRVGPARYVTYDDVRQSEECGPKTAKAIWNKLPFQSMEQVIASLHFTSLLHGPSRAAHARDDHGPVASSR